MISMSATQIAPEPPVTGEDHTGASAAPPAVSQLGSSSVYRHFGASCEGRLEREEHDRFGNLLRMAEALHRIVFRHLSPGPLGCLLWQSSLQDARIDGTRAHSVEPVTAWQELASPRACHAALACLLWRSSLQDARIDGTSALSVDPDPAWQELAC